MASASGIPRTRLEPASQHLSKSSNAWLTPNSTSSYKAVAAAGRYKQTKSCFDEKLESPSQGMRGTGSFASLSKRFGRSQYVTSSPGPQKYVAFSPTSEFCGYSFTSALAQGGIFSETCSPGPKYLCRTGVPSSGVRSCSSDFSPGNERETSVEKEEEGKSLPRKQGYAMSCDTFFKSPPRKREVVAQPKLPTGSDCYMHKNPHVFSNPDSRTSWLPPSKEEPGPGGYDQKPLCWSGTSCGELGSSAFQPGEVPNFIPKNNSPGPGRYAPSLNRSGAPTLAQSGGAVPAMRDVSGRLYPQDAPANPGPAFYGAILKPKVKAAFHVNERGRWI